MGDVWRLPRYFCHQSPTLYFTRKLHQEIELGSGQSCAHTRQRSTRPWLCPKSQRLGSLLCRHQSWGWVSTCISIYRREGMSALSDSLQVSALTPGCGSAQEGYLSRLHTLDLPDQYFYWGCLSCYTSGILECSMIYLTIFNIGRCYKIHLDMPTTHRHCSCLLHGYFTGFLLCPSFFPGIQRVVLHLIGHAENHGSARLYVGYSYLIWKAFCPLRQLIHALALIP